MKGFRHSIRNFFGFSRAQTNGFVVLLFIVVVALLSKPVYHAWISQRSPDFSGERTLLDSLTRQWEYQQQEKNKIPLSEEMTVTLFEFNPNTVTEQELLALGFSERLAKRFMNYRTKGGTFRIKSDLKKLYGMDSSFYASLEPYIQLPEKLQPDGKPGSVAKMISPKSIVPFDLNRADTAQLLSIYGVGPVFAKRIFKYRESLGGFIHTEQVKEIYGLDSTVVKEILKSTFLDKDFSPRKININTADEKLLSAHPYFSRKAAKAIVTYRFQHGNFRSVDDLRKINLLEGSTIDKIQPYLAFE